MGADGWFRDWGLGNPFRIRGCQQGHEPEKIFLSCVWLTVNLGYDCIWTNDFTIEMRLRTHASVCPFQLKISMTPKICRFSVTPNLFRWFKLEYYKKSTVFSLAKKYHNGYIVQVPVLIITDNSFLLHLFHQGAYSRQFTSPVVSLP